jgi:hypothetical protein
MLREPAGSATLQGQAGMIGKDVNPLAAGLRPVPVIEHMAAVKLNSVIGVLNS